MKDINRRLEKVVKKNTSKTKVQRREDKPLDYRQNLFVEYYTGGNEEKGNAYKSARKAGYSHIYADQACKWLIGNNRIKAEIEKRKAYSAKKIETNVELQTKRITEQYIKANSKDDIRAALQATDQLNKHIGYYDADNK
ncbi:MAG: terminase small subunit [Planctomycetota bacterium]|jgi:phage terminase small subunit